MSLTFSRKNEVPGTAATPTFSALNVQGVLMQGDDEDGCPSAWRNDRDCGTIAGMKETIAIVVVAVAATCGAGATDAFEPLPPGAVKLSGGLAEPIAKSLAHWHKGNVPYSAFAEFFRTGRPQFALGEMWGKFVRSGAMQYRHSPDPELKAVLDSAVKDILSTERENGSISCVPVERQPAGGDGVTKPDCGDLWERKYVMLGLEDYYEWVVRDPAVLASLERQAACIMDQIGPAPKMDVRDAGWSANHVESSTLLEPFMRLHRLTGNGRYLDFARYLVACGGAKGSDLVQMAHDNVPPHLMGGAYPKAYETTSYFEGLVEYFRVTGDGRVGRAIRNYFDLVLSRELTIIGNGGGDQPYHPKVMGEAWVFIVKAYTPSPASCSNSVYPAFVNGSADVTPVITPFACVMPVIT